MLNRYYATADDNTVVENFLKDPNNNGQKFPPADVNKNFLTAAGNLLFVHNNKGAFENGRPMILHEQAWLKGIVHYERVEPSTMSTTLEEQINKNMAIKLSCIAIDEKNNNYNVFIIGDTNSFGFGYAIDDQGLLILLIFLIYFLILYIDTY